ncbi:MAG: glycosyltransferase family 1 protein, partial [Candidatus Moraniibacteriota bacterium]
APVIRQLVVERRTGDEAVFFNLTKEILKLDHENHYFLLTDEKEPEKLDFLRERLGVSNNPHATVVTLVGKNRFLWNLLSLPGYLLRHKLDVYHTQYIAPFFLPRRTALVTHVHDVSFKAHAEWIGRKDLFFLSLLIPSSLRRSTTIVVPSLFTKEEVIKFYHVPSEKVVVVSNSFETSWLTLPSNEEQAEAKKRLSLSGPYFVAAGTMQPRKNIPFLIQAFRRLREKEPRLTLVLTGDPVGHHVDPGVKALSEKGEPGIVFTGYLPEKTLRAIIAGSEGLVFPSLYEGFGIPLLEGMASGVPILASNILPFQEVAGKAALFFDPASLAEVENALYTLYIDRAAHDMLIALGRERLALFSWAKSAEKLLAVYQKS